jgi:hypothetical protein
MLGHGTRDARRTERYLNGLMIAAERRVSEVPVDVEVDPAVRFAARELRACLTRVHPSFRFEEALAARLAAAALRQRAGLPVAETVAPATAGTVAPFRSHSARGAKATVSATAAATAAATGPVDSPAGHFRAVWPAAAFRRLPEMATHPSRPLLVGGVGVGVASAAISIGAVYVAWRHSHPAAGRMGRAARAAHGRTAHSGRNRRTGVVNGIIGVVS